MLYDCVIVGGGAVGTSLALALGQQKYKVLLLEKNAPLVKPEDKEARTLALSYASYRIYSALGVWEKLKTRAVPIQQVLVSMKGHYGACRLNHEGDSGEPLGYVVGLTELEQALYNSLAHQPSVDIFRPATLVNRTSTPEAWHLTIQRATHEITEKLLHVDCKLLIAADGVDSILREEQSISQQKKTYEHYAVMANVQMARAHDFVAYERFLPHGAIALLPWQANLATCIWTASKSEVDKLVNLKTEDFLAQCSEHLGARVGRLQTLSKRVSFPLQMQLACQQESARFLLMGNAAHSLHPIAAQGLNLSLRDVWQIRNQLIKAKEQCDIGSTFFLNEYLHARKPDQQRIIFATDAIARGMTTKVLPSWLRAMGITLFDCLSPLKRKFTHMGMGLS